MIFNDPQNNIEKIIGYAKYCYRKHGIVMRVVNMYRDFGVTNFTINWKSNDTKVKKVINDYNERVNITQVMKDMIHELALTGNLACYDRDGNNVEIYPVDRIEVLPITKNGKQLIGYKTSDIEDSDDDFGDAVSKKVANAYPSEILKAIRKNDTYAILDDKLAFFEKVNSSRYEKYGLSILVPAFEDIAHKNLLKQVEKSVSNSIIEKVLLVQVGDADHRPTQNLIDKYANVFSNLSFSSTVVVPYYVNMRYVEPETSSLNAEKFIEVDVDILNTLGISMSLLRGEGKGSYSDGLVNFTGICKCIDNVRMPIVKIINEIYKNELARNGIDTSLAPTIKLDDVVIDQTSKTDLMVQLFQNAGLPYEVLYQGCGLDFDNVKNLREKENKNNYSDIFKLREQPFQGNQFNTDDNGGRPQKNQTQRQTDNNQSNNDQARPSAKKMTGQS